jgi:hypothetical protein
MLVSDKITPAWLNTLSIEARAKVLDGDFGTRMHTWAASYITFFRWARSSLLGTTVNSASGFFLDVPSKLLFVTAAHVWDGFLLAKKKAGKKIICHVGNIEFDPEARLVGYNQGLDIATFDLRYEDLVRTGKQAISTMLWPPPEPVVGQSIFLGGFPAVSRFWVRRNAMNFGLYLARNVIRTVSERQITSRFEREDWIPATGWRIPPRGMDLGGLSGGPVMLPLGSDDGTWNFCLGGVISQAHASNNFETIVAVRAHFINHDGSISRL